MPSIIQPESTSGRQSWMRLITASLSASAVGASSSCVCISHKNLTLIEMHYGTLDAARALLGLLLWGLLTGLLLASPFTLLFAVVANMIAGEWIKCRSWIWLAMSCPLAFCISVLAFWQGPILLGYGPLHPDGFGGALSWLKGRKTVLF
jgi:heme/copper-type cytochrome/quinol oxidase subunit 3